MDFFLTIKYSIFLAGCVLLAIMTLRFFWHLVIYATSRGEDARRNEAKVLVLRLTAYILLLMILWALVTWVGAYLGF